MKLKSLKIAALILSIGLVLTVIVCLCTNIILTPAVTEHEFSYSVTYKLNGETKTIEGVYKCTYEGFNEGNHPRDRYYSGEFIVDGQKTPSHTYTIAEKDGAELYIVTLFNDYYLMNDTKSEGYEPFLDDPYLESIDQDGCEILPEDRPAEFTAEILRWEHPEPIENKFTFDRFSLMHVESMLAMLAVGLLSILACIIFVRKDNSVSYNILDAFSIVLNCVACIFAIPFITVTTALFQLTMSTDGILYQIYLCIPVLTAFTVAASIALRRKGFRKTGFFLPFIGPMIYIVLLFSELF